MPIAPGRGGQYSADHIQWYPLVPTPQRRSYLTSQHQDGSRAWGTGPTYAGGKYDEAVEVGGEPPSQGVGR
jgi:hypothetical protein